MQPNPTELFVEAKMAPNYTGGSPQQSDLAPYFEVVQELVANRGYSIRAAIRWVIDKGVHIQNPKSASGAYRYWLKRKAGMKKLRGQSLSRHLSKSTLG